MPSETAVATHLDGLDHIVLAVKDLDDSAEAWRRAGFTVSPRGVHSDYLGTGNHTIMLEDDYVELLGVLKPTEFNTPTRDFLARGEGLERLAMRARDTEAAVATLRAEGRAVEGPFHFSRPVEVAGKPDAVASFAIFQWPPEAAAEGARLFACQHLTRDTVWLPALTSHANGATALTRVDRRSESPEASARDHAAVIGAAAVEIPGGWAIAAEGRGPAVHYLGADAFAAIWGEDCPTACAALFSVTETAKAAAHAKSRADLRDAPLVADVPGARLAFRQG